MIKLKDIIGEDVAKDIAKEITQQNEAIKGYDQAMKKMLNFMKKSAEAQFKKSFTVLLWVVLQGSIMSLSTLYAPITLSNNL